MTWKGGGSRFENRTVEICYPSLMNVHVAQERKFPSECSSYHTGLFEPEQRLRNFHASVSLVKSSLVHIQNKLLKIPDSKE